MLCCLSGAVGAGAGASVRLPRSSELANSLSLSKEAGEQGQHGTDTAGSGTEEPILISEVEVRGVDGELKRIAESKLTIKPNFAYTLSEVRDDIQRVFDAGYFQQITPAAEDTRDGIKLTLQATANPVIKGVVVTGANVLPQREIEEAFRDQAGRTLNFPAFSSAVKRLNRWYEDRGIFGQVTEVDDTGGVINVKLAEMVVGNLNLRYVDRKTGEVREEGATRPEVVLRQLATRPGQVYNVRQAKMDIDAVYSMGLFDDVTILPQPAEDSTLEHPKVDLVLNVVERKTGGLSCGGGISSQGHSEGALPGFIGSASFSQRNLFGLNQKLAATVEIGQVDSLFRVNHTDPWVKGDPYRTSRTISLQNTRTSGNPVHGRAPDDCVRPGSEEEASPEGSVVVARLMGGVEYGRPLATGWTGTLGVNWQRAKCLDEHGNCITQDAYGSPLTFSGGRSDTLMLALLRAAYSGGQDAHLVASMEQALPLQSDWLNFNRFCLRAERGMQIYKGLRAHLSAKGGVILGDLPPYEAFPIGGTNSVRGYSEGGVGSGRNYVTGTAGLHWPIFGPVDGALFFDYGTDLDSGQTVLGDPAGARGKPGSGYGFGAGIRVDSPVGPLRLEYAFNDKFVRRFHFGIGSHG
ncbi:Outer envelope protein 80, chloroplastic [Coccomyxa sp. Obi]|nr:Outer envelope protein 80, chloroplastic [Coccomyxa sp. Obi]